MLSPHIDTTKSAAVDCMHVALEGVMKTLLAICLDSKYYADHFYLGSPSIAKEIDK